MINDINEMTEIRDTQKLMTFIISAFIMLIVMD